MFHNSMGEIECARIVPVDTYVAIGGTELLVYHRFRWKTTKPIPTLGKLGLNVAGLFQPYQNRALPVLLRKRNQHSRLVLRAPTISNATTLNPDCRAGCVMGAE